MLRVIITSGALRCLCPEGLFTLFLGVSAMAFEGVSGVSFLFFISYRIYFGEVQLNGLGEGMYAFRPEILWY